MVGVSAGLTEVAFCASSYVHNTDGWCQLMFSVQGPQHEDFQEKIIASGITFGRLGKYVVFEITATGIDTALKFKFWCGHDENKKPFYIEVSPIKDNEWEIKFYNPSVGNSGLKSPVGIVLDNECFLGFMFMVDTLTDPTSYRLSYEFYEGKPPVFQFGK